MSIASSTLAAEAQTTLQQCSQSLETERFRSSSTVFFLPKPMMHIAYSPYFQNKL